jgi:DNA-binding transcriptional regulator YiaG
MTALLEEVRTRRRLPAPSVAKAIRTAAGVSQQRVAEELHVHRVTVARWEDGTRRPSGRLLGAYLELLEQLREVTAA